VVEMTRQVLIREEAKPGSVGAGAELSTEAEFHGR
jgi:hypothetical protein